MTDDAGPRAWQCHPNPCGLCGREPALGFASVWEGDKQVWLCHPDEGFQDCYHQWTVWGYRKPGDDLYSLGPMILTPDRLAIIEAALERARKTREAEGEP